MGLWVFERGWSGKGVDSLSLIYRDYGSEKEVEPKESQAL